MNSNPLCWGKNQDSAWNLSNLLNRTKFLDEANELPQFFCLYYSVSDILARLTIATGVAKVVGCVLGVIGSIAAIITFTSREFRTCSFSYHCIINIADLLNSLMFLDDGMTFILGTSSRNPYSAWFFARYYFLSPANELCLYWINLLTAWVAVERCAATLLPSSFPRISNKKTVISVTINTFLVNFFVYLPKQLRNGYAFDKQRKEFILVANEFQKSYTFAVYMDVLHAYMSVVACLVSVGTAGVVVGLVKITKRKRKLVQPNSALYRNRELARQCSLNSQLCILQLCQGIPLIAHEILHVTYDRILPFPNGLDSIRRLPVEKTYEELVADVSTYIVSQHLWFVVRLISVFSHCCHFYLYMTFGSKVRRFVLKATKRLAKRFAQFVLRL